MRSTQYSLVGEIAVSDICEYYQYWSYMPRGRVVCTIIFLVFLYILYIFLNVCYYYYDIDLVLFFFFFNF